MVNIFHNLYRIPSARLPHWDYSQNGYYFITICTYKKNEYFGEIINGKINLSEIGEIAQTCWKEISIHFPFVELDEFVIMPNHLHGIIIICKNQRRDGACPISTKHKNSLGNIVGSFKSVVTKYANSHQIPFHWQSRYFDHIIRSESSYLKIKQYIRDNPQNWEEDRNNSDYSLIM